jgi:hypothetical protein
MLKVFSLSLILVSATIAEQFTSSKMKPMVQELKQNKYENAIKIAVSGSILEENAIKDENNKDELIAQIETMHKNYGNFVDFEKVYETTLGKITKVYYFVYCLEHPIKVEAVLYNLSGKEKLIEFNFDDKAAELVERLDLIKRPNK